jgi:HemK-related putative methylase
MLIDPLVYKPAADSYLLADHVLSHRRVGLAVELGGGTGIVSLAASIIASTVLTYETNVYAYRNILTNIEINHLNDKIKVFLDEGLNGPKADLVIINPPYLPQEPLFRQDSLSTAWNGGPDGLRVTLRMIHIGVKRMKKNGSMLIVYSSLQKESRFVKALKRQSLEYDIIGSKREFYEELRVYECHKNAN